MANNQSNEAFVAFEESRVIGAGILYIDDKNKKNGIWIMMEA